MNPDWWPYRIRFSGPDERSRRQGLQCVKVKYAPMKLFKKLGLMLVMLVMVAQAQQRAFDLIQAASKGDAAALAQLKTLGNKGDIVAQRAIGVMYDLGNGVPKDFVEAVFWYRKSANQGDSKGQGLLSTMYRNGHGVPKDLVIAYMWCNLAAAQGEEIAKEGRELLGKIMTPAQIAEAQKLSREWKPKP